ncbi:hypothetical protein F6Q10_10390 [Streptomyces vinaceus]|nr:hypothetical protein [Streptomyces vinaceus]
MRTVRCWSRSSPRPWRARSPQPAGIRAPSAPKGLGGAPRAARVGAGGTPSGGGTSQRRAARRPHGHRGAKHCSPPGAGRRGLVAQFLAPLRVATA